MLILIITTSLCYWQGTSMEADKSIWCQ